MKLILGIGNPGKSYQQNRHNAGIIFVDWLASKSKLSVAHQTSSYIQYSPKSTDKIICNSLVYMNLSGRAIASIKKKNPSLLPQNIMVVHDDLEHKLGNIRIKDGGSSQGHNGIESIISSIKSKNIKKLQIGISRPVSRDPEIVSKYVLSNFPSSELETLKNSFKKAEQLLKQHQFI